MNARFLTTVRVGLTMTAVALCGAMALSGNTGCASSDSNGGSAGSSNGGSTGNGGTSGGNGGSSGTPSSCTAGADSVCFAAGKATGVMTGYGYIALGKADTATFPVCDNTANPGGGASEAITADKPCPENGGKSVWNTPNAGLCITGTIPVVTGGDYTGNWGLQIGCNVSDPAGGTLGVAYSKITFAFNDSAVTPKNTQIRGEIHVKDDAPDKTYCATVTPGVATSLIAFNTECWGSTGVNLTADMIPNIDKIGLQVSSDITYKYDVKDLCWSGLTFTK